MGKKGHSLFDAYFESGAPNENNKDDSTPLPDSMRTSTLLEQMGKERSWTDDQVDNDISILEKNRLYLVRDLRVLSNHSWLLIDVLPIVRDLLKQAIHPNGVKQGRMATNDSVEDWTDNLSSDYKAEKKKKNKEKKEKKKKMGESVKPTKRVMVGGLDEVALTEDMDNTNLLASPEVMKDVLSEDPETIRNTIRNGSIDVGKEDALDMKKQQQQQQQNNGHQHQQKKSVSFASKNGIIPQQQPDRAVGNSLVYDNSDDNGSSSSSSSGSDDDNNTIKHQQQRQQKDLSQFGGLRPIKAVAPNRIQVKTTTGQVYECDRYCPHKGVDLSTWGQVLGDTLVCTKHNWRFSLSGNSLGNEGRSVHPCKLNDW